MASTYEPIASITVGTAAASVEFTSIPGTMTDLICVMSGSINADSNIDLRFNTATSGYSRTWLNGSGSAASSGRNSNAAYINASPIGTLTNNLAMVRVHIMAYANTNVYKTVLIEAICPATAVTRTVGMWSSTSAITTVKFLADEFASGKFATGTTFSLYGIKAA